MPVSGNHLREDEIADAAMAKYLQKSENFLRVTLDKRHKGVYSKNVIGTRLKTIVFNTIPDKRDKPAYGMTREQAERFANLRADYEIQTRGGTDHETERMASYDAVDGPLPGRMRYDDATGL